MFSSKFLIAVLVLMLGATAAQAYTIVLRSGRHIEIPNTFTLTNSTLTYEAAPEIQITIQLSSIDIAATERANGEPSGSFLLKASEPKVVVPAVQTRPRAERSITNQDLEVYRRARVESEREYERQRKELGLPSREERRQELADIEERTQEQVRRMQARQEEVDLRTRASALRAEVAAVEARLGAVRSQLDDVPFGYPVGAFTTPFPFGFGAIGFPAVDFPFHGFHGFNRFHRANRFRPHFPGFSGFKSPHFGGHFRLRFGFPNTRTNTMPGKK
jgi:hypothetical protein